ncbi:MAG: 30S ribosomal protein S20 [Akkermansiaceae bacterium]|jgi:small subunit ribosomal protein S20|nr:30S ribosomal protein S20 [Akkermansiaceae bacterium]
MANHKSALKRVRQTKVRTERNRQRKTTIKKLRKDVLSSITGGEKPATAEAIAKFSSAVDKAAKVGLIHKNKASNLKSKAAKALAAAH